MTSTLKTQLMRPRREPKRGLCYQLEKHLKISEVKNPWTIGWHGCSVKGDCRLCNQLGVQPLLSAQDDRVAAVAQGASQCSAPWCAALFGSPVSHHCLWPPFPCGAHWVLGVCVCVCVCPRQCVPFLLIHELLLQLVSDDTVGGWLGWADGREELATTWEDWKERVDMSSKGPPCAAFSLWGHTAPCHTVFDSVMFLLCRLTGTVRQRFWFVAMSKQTLCKYGCGGRHTLDPCWDVAKWCFDHMLRGCMATRRHDENPGLHQIGGERLAVAGPQCCNFVEVGLCCRGRLDS